jgi:dienelactone hydrolase
MTDGEALSCIRVEPEGEPRSERVILLHGGGTSGKERMLPIAQDFADAGFHAATFDFSGHGQSTGHTRHLTLERRFIQARSVIDELAPNGDPLMLIGFSMSGQTIADLFGHYGKRVSTIILGAPAAYAPEAWKLPFGDGTGEFTNILRTKRSWLNSGAFAQFSQFEGRAILVLPGQDNVIPPGVTFRIEAALRKKSQFCKFRLPEAGHMLGQWFSEHPVDRSRLVELRLSADPEREQA